MGQGCWASRSNILCTNIDVTIEMVLRSRMGLVVVFNFDRFFFSISFSFKLSVYMVDYRGKKIEGETKGGKTR